MLRLFGIMNRAITLLAILLLSTVSVNAQSITGVWRGKLSRGLKHYNLELKLIRNGDSLTGTSYYYQSANHYSRFRVKGYFDRSGDIVWWDKELIEMKGSKISSPNSDPLRFAADFNCPGNDVMMLDGNAVKAEDDDKPMEVHLSKMDQPLFKDEWDEVIEDFPYYASVPGQIDSIERGSVTSSPVALEKPKTEPAAKKPDPVSAQPAEKKSMPPIVLSPPKAKTIEEKYFERKKLLVTEIPVSGDSIKLAFYDHAEIDGDSITLFLNGQFIHQHILLKAQPFEFTLAVSNLSEDNELIMVAENLGSIPPNTSLMIVWINGVRHEARLESTENSSAMIRFTKKKPLNEQALRGAPKLP